MQTITFYAENREAEATRRYNDRYDNMFYQRATHGKSNRYANHLIDVAMALCGSPYYKINPGRKYSKAALDFLALFQ